MKQLKWNTDRIIGLSAMLISLLTLIIFVYQTNLMRTQSRLSVTPRISFNQNQSDQDSIIYISAEIVNKGLGPAIIESIYIRHKKKKFELDFDAFLKEAYPEIGEYGLLKENTTMSKGSTLAANERNTLYVFAVIPSKVDALLQYLGTTTKESPFDVEVIYSSIYQEKWITNDRQDGHPVKL